VRGRPLAFVWIGAAVVLVLLIGVALTQWRSLAGRGQRAAGERVLLANAIRAKEEEIVGFMHGNVGLLQEMQWTSASGDPAAFLTRLADLAREKRTKVIGIGPLERSATAQFNKSWHTIQIVGPYRELRDLAGRVEAEKGILEDVTVTAVRDAGRPGGPRADEVEARFKMTALELTPDARKVFERAVAARGGATAGTTAPSLALPLPVAPAEVGSDARDPFATTTAMRRPAPSGAGTPSPVTSPAGASGGGGPVGLELKGIVGFPGGHLAIVNNQIVKTGDTVLGHRVERIAEDAVVFREPGGGTRRVTLPGLADGPPGGPRR
jgi:hypothetical protein